MKILPAAFYFLLFTFNSFAQSVGINNTGTAPDNSALLDLSATDKGFLITRVDTASIASPAFGLMTLSPNDSCLYLYNGVSWMGMGGGGHNCICGELISGGTPPQSRCGAPFTDVRDGKTYGKVEIGSQWWMCENLNYTPSSGNSWCYDNDPVHCNTYGRLYDWNTASNSTSSAANPSGVEGVCPAGWHLPSDAEWKELEMELGMSPAAANNPAWRGSNQGDQLKSSTDWNGNNSSGFTALPGGHRSFVGDFVSEGFHGFWWSATMSSLSQPWTRSIISIRTDIDRMDRNKGMAFSVRCVQN